MAARAQKADLPNREGRDALAAVEAHLALYRKTWVAESLDGAVLALPALRTAARECMEKAAIAAAGAARDCERSLDDWGEEWASHASEMAAWAARAARMARRASEACEDEGITAAGATRRRGEAAQGRDYRLQDAARSEG